MIKSFWQRNWQHFAAIAIFLLVAVIYCKPALQGLVVDQHDITGWKGMAQQSAEFKEKYGHYPYWTNSMFSGMPGYQIAFETPNKISIGILHNYVFTLGLPKPINYFLLASVMAYFLFCVLRINPWIGVMCALCYAYATFDPIIVAVGHDTQMICIGYAPGVIASLLLLFDGKYILGTVLTALMASMIIWQNHVQITYYTTIIAVCLSIGFLIHCIRGKEVKKAVIAGALSLIAGGIALGVNTINIWPINELASETMRNGRSELADTANAKNKTKGGLDKDYAFAYSVGKAETFTIMVPRLYGGSSRTVVNNEYKTEFKADGELAKAFSEKTGVPEEQALDYISQIGLSPYWGDQQPTSGPVYLGAIICFLFVLGMVYVKSWHKWWILGATIFGIILAWGKNLEGINYFLFDNMPLYKKFRAPSMAMVIPQLTFPVLAGLALNQFISESNKELLWKKLKLAGLVTGALFAVLALMYFSFDYAAPGEKDMKSGLSNMMLQQQAKGQQPTPQMQAQAEDFGKSIVTAMHKDRASLFGSDLLRSFLFVAVAFGFLYLYAKNKLKAIYVITGVGILSCVDVIGIATRYLSYKNYAELSVAEAAFNTNSAIEKIKADPNHKNVRVFDQSDFSSSTISYYFNSIGGYSPAKLGLYQDLIANQITKGHINVLNMLNAKYFIVQNSASAPPDAQINPDALGNCWFVKGFSIAKNADEEMKELDNLNTRDSAVIDERFKAIAGNQPVYDSTAKIVLKENLNDQITYESKATGNQFAVFSEIYYPHGWDAYIDGNKVDYCRVNYVLRGMPVPAGTHTIAFRFEPRSVILGDKITMWFNILIYLMLIAGIVLELRKKKA